MAEKVTCVPVEGIVVLYTFPPHVDAAARPVVVRNVTWENDLVKVQGAVLRAFIVQLGLCGE